MPFILCFPQTNKPVPRPGSSPAKVLLLPLLIGWLMVSCGEKPVPKPSGYFRIAFQEKNYQPFPAGFPYSFDIPGYARVEKDPSVHAEPSWINIVFPQYKAEIHLSYKNIRNNLYVFTEESRELAYEHTLKASSIEEKNYLHPDVRVSGTLYFIRGNAASPLQFYMTDSVRHFLRGALYIRATPNIDSLKPVIEYLEKDVIRMIETLRWNN